MPALTYRLQVDYFVSGFSPNQQVFGGPGYQLGWFLQGGATLTDCVRIKGDGDYAQAYTAKTFPQPPIAQSFLHFFIDSQNILLNGVTNVNWAGLPAGFIPLTAQVDFAITNTAGVALCDLYLQFDQFTESPVMVAKNDGVTYSFAYPGSGFPGGSLPPIDTLIANGCGCRLVSNQGSGFADGNINVDFLQISGTYGIATTATKHYQNLTLNRFKLSSSLPVGGGWAVIPDGSPAIPAPKITSITPTEGTVSGGTFVTIFGTGFDDGAGFGTTIGGNALGQPLVLNSTTITGVTAAHVAGAVDVVVENSDGTLDTLVGGFTYVAISWWALGPWAFFDGPPYLLDYPDGIPITLAPTPLIPTPRTVPPSPSSVPRPWAPFVGAPPDTAGWYWSNNGFTGASQLALNPGPPMHARAAAKITPFAASNSRVLQGLPSVNYHNRIIYAGDDYTKGTTAPTIRIFDGVTDRLLSIVPNTTTPTVPFAILTMLLVGDTVYFSTLDSGTTSANYTGRVFSFNLITQQMGIIATVFTGGLVPYALAWHMDRLWVGTNHSNGTLGTLYWFRPGIDSAWTAETGTITGGICSLMSFEGSLYIGCDNASGTFAKIYKRDSTATYTLSLTASGGAATVNNGFLDLLVNNGLLYATYWNGDSPAVAKVYVKAANNGAWSTSYTGTSNTITPYIAIFAFNGVIYVLGGGNGLQCSLISLTVFPAGNAWVDLSAELNTIATETALPVFGQISL